MNVLRRIAMAIGGTVVVALCFALAAPKTVRAVVTALVTVANTSANPVPTTDVMRSVTQNVELHCQPSLNGGPSCILVPPTGVAGNEPQYIVPSGSNLVITDVEVFAPQSGSPTAFLLLSTTPANPVRIENWVVAGDGATHEFEFPSGIVIPPGATLTSATNASGGALTIIRGYLTAN
ncbi:MAG: hypothetical protein ACHP8A_08605 [Terriglobales bacterium]